MRLFHIPQSKIWMVFYVRLKWMFVLSEMNMQIRSLWRGIIAKLKGLNFFNKREHRFSSSGLRKEVDEKRNFKNSIKIST